MDHEGWEVHQDSHIIVMSSKYSEDVIQEDVPRITGATVRVWLAVLLSVLAVVLAVILTYFITVKYTQCDTTTIWDDGTINISYSAYNELEGNETQFWAGVMLRGQPKPFVQFLDEAALVNPELRYNSTKDPVYGTYVVAIRGVYARLEEHETYWAFLMRRNGTLCGIPLGVDEYVPSNGDHIIFQYVLSDFYKTSCFD